MAEMNTKIVKAFSQFIKNRQEHETPDPVRQYLPCTCSKAEWNPPPQEPLAASTAAPEVGQTGLGGRGAAPSLLHPLLPQQNAEESTAGYFLPPSVVQLFCHCSTTHGLCMEVSGITITAVFELKLIS